MKFERITGRNFKSFDEFDFAPEKTTCAIVGGNGKGKTSITQMIQFAISGQCPDDVIKAGKDTMSVELEMVDADGRSQNWERTKSNSSNSKVRTNGKASTGKALAAHIESITGVPLESLKLSSSSELIENLKPVEFSEFIMNYVPEALDYETIKGYMGPSATPQMLEVLEKSGIIPMSETFGYEKIQEIYNYVFDKRKSVRSLMTTYQAKSQVSIEKPSKTAEEIDKRLEEIIKEESTYYAAKKLYESYLKSEEAKKKQEENINDLQSKIDALVVEKPDPAFRATNDATKRELNSSIISLKTTVATLENNIKIFKNTIANLDKPTCPLSEGLICKTDKSAKRQEFMDQVSANEKSIETLKAEIADKQSKYEEVVAKETVYIEQEKKYHQKQLLISQLEAAKKSLIALPTKVLEPPAVADYTAEKNKLRQMKDNIVKYTQYVEDHKKFIELSDEKDVLDALVKMFAPKGDVSLKVTQHYFGIFEDVCNERAAELKPGFTLKFVPDDGIKILCETEPGRGYIPYQACSSGERAFVIFLLTDLISCALTKSNILILDDLDKLDNEAFNSLLKCIMQPSVQESYDHIILCAVNHEDTLETLAKYPEIQVKTI